MFANEYCQWLDRYWIWNEVNKNIFPSFCSFVQLFLWDILKYKSLKNQNIHILIDSQWSSLQITNGEKCDLEINDRSKLTIKKYTLPPPKKTLILILNCIVDSSFLKFSPSVVLKSVSYSSKKFIWIFILQKSCCHSGNFPLWCVKKIAAHTKHATSGCCYGRLLLIKIT